MTKSIEKLQLGVSEYSNMDIEDIVIHCPYWSNKLFAGKVILRGFANGKGQANDIKNELKTIVHNELVNIRKISQPEIFLQKLARRKRIGIDCSGFVYRMLESYLQTDLISIYHSGINRTNATMITDPTYVFPIQKVKNIIPGDVIRLMGGSHIAIVSKILPQSIEYAHSSHKTQVSGVHTGSISITNWQYPLKLQKWQEQTASGKEFVEEFFQEEEDGVYRLKILQYE